jgi:hypothetical protein
MLFGPAGNKLVAPSGYMATAAWRISACEIGIWVIPLLAIGCGVLLLRCT